MIDIRPALLVVGVLAATISSDAAAALTATAAPQYLGARACAACHAKEYELWRGSHHDLAMQEASAGTVLGDFKDARFTYAGVTSRFFERDGKYFVNTDGPEGQLRDYEIRYTFGVAPLQQYLVEFPGGRLQALGIAWDTRPKEQGGQRWFHLYPDQTVTHADPLHWTGRNQNWNFMCAECHSTNLRKGYDLAADRYATTWSEINVSCEACHGPGSNHVAWAHARAAQPDGKDTPANDLVVALGAATGEWAFAEGGGATKHWVGAPRPEAELETCAPCHSRRRNITAESRPGDRYLDRYVPALLTEGLYAADGQVVDEVYEHGSFLQSKMHRAGVTCSDCHDPHSLKLRAPGNQLCTQCHAVAVFDTSSHHHHPAGSLGAQCVGCHMPERSFMVVDGRRDHSLRIPRPDLSLTYRTPDPCLQCHTTQNDSWAADAVASWYGPRHHRDAHFVAALDAGRRGRVAADRYLTALAGDPNQPPIARATALSLLPARVGADALPALQAGLAHSDALVRLGATRAAAALPPAARPALLAPRLTDPVRSVRIAAARALAATPQSLSSPDQQRALQDGIAELIASELANAERPESHLNLSVLYAEQGRLDAAETELAVALRLDPNFVPALVNVADLYRLQNRDAEGERFLRQAMAAAPDAAEPVHALGLLRTRQKRIMEATELLGKAAELQPGNARYAYVYGVALQATGEMNRAIAVLERAHALHPADRDIIIALIDVQRQRGDLSTALKYADELVRLEPNDPGVGALREELRRSGPPP